MYEYSEISDGILATGKPIHWVGAAFFQFQNDTIAQVWVLGDLIALDALLEENHATQRRNQSQSAGF